VPSKRASLSKVFPVTYSEYLTASPTPHICRYPFCFARPSGRAKASCTLPQAVNVCKALTQSIGFSNFPLAFHTVPSMKTTLFALMALLCFSFVASAASVDGKWTAEVPGRGGNTQTNTFTFKSAGNAVEGTITNMRGDTPIAEGKLDGDTLTFSVSRPGRDGATMKTTYTGKVKGDSIDFTVEGGRGPQTFTAKKAQ